MLLSTFVTFTVFGFGVWLLGHLLRRNGGSKIFLAVAAIGAVLIMVTGGAVALTDVEQPTGQVIDKDYDQHVFGTGQDDAYVNNRTIVTETTTRISITDQFGVAFGQLGLGGLELIVGALLLMADLEEMSF